MRIQLKKRDVIWNYLGVVMNLGGNFLILPFLLYFLDDSRYGLWNIFVSLGGIVALFDFGFNTTFARNITFCWSGAKALSKESVEYSDSLEPDFLLIKKVLATCRIIYLMISLVALICIGLLGSVYIYYIGKELTGSDYLIAWLIYSIAIFMNLYYGYYDSFLRGIGAIAEVNKIKIYSRVIQIVLVAVLLNLGFGIIGASLAYLGYGMFFRIVAKRKFFASHNIGKRLNSITEKVTRKDIQEIFNLVWHNAWRDGLVSVANYLSNQATVLIGSLYLTLAETGAYSLAVQLAQAIAQISSALYMAYQPTLQSAYVARNNEKIKNTLSAILLSFICLSIAGFGALFVIGLPIIRIIKPNAILNPIAILAVGIYQCMLKGRNCYTSYISSTNRVPYARAFVVSGILCVTLSFIFEEFIIRGIWGLIFAQIISQAVFNSWYWPMFVHKELKLKIFEVFPRGWKELRLFYKKDAVPRQFD